MSVNCVSSFCLPALKWRLVQGLTSPPLLRQLLLVAWCHSPIQTSPNCPAPSFCSSLRDSLGISHSSCHQGFCGALDWHGFTSFVHKPSESPALHWTRRGDEDRIQTETRLPIGNNWLITSGCTHGGDAGQVPSTRWKRSWLWYSIHHCPCCGSCSAWPLHLCWGPSPWLIRHKTLEQIGIIIIS